MFEVLVHGIIFFPRGIEIGIEYRVLNFWYRDTPTSHSFSHTHAHMQTCTHTNTNT